jgi:hypothetical protein
MIEDHDIDARWEVGQRVHLRRATLDADEVEGTILEVLSDGLLLQFDDEDGTCVRRVMDFKRAAVALVPL